MNYKSIYFFLCSFLLILSCTEKKTGSDRFHPEFTNHISAFSSGVISKSENIRIELTKANNAFTESGARIGKRLFKFSPTVQGESYWIDDQTIEFRPSENLNSGTEYEIEFALGELLEVPAYLKRFYFTLRTITQSFEVYIDGTEPYDVKDPSWNVFKGRLVSADNMEDQVAESLVNVQIDGKACDVKWVHNSFGRTHVFSVDSIERITDSRNVQVNFSGSNYGIKTKGSKEYTIPSINDFKYLSSKVIHKPEQHVIIKFSDPIDSDQDLNGIFSLDDHENFKFQIRNNEISIYPSSSMSGVKTLKIQKALRNTIGKQLKENKSIELSFEESKPEIAFNHTGTILPNVKGMIIPFKTINLTAVDIEVIKVYEKNVHQFLQVNDFSGDYQMRRVGRKVLKKKIDLDSDDSENRNIWNNHFVDLSDLINAEPGAIYKVILSMKKAYSSYSCDSSDESEDTENPQTEYYDDSDYELDNWEYYEDSYSYYNYNWEERDNPCSSAYYHNGRSISTNIFSSNIGLIAKMGKDRNLWLSASDIRDAQPISNLEIRIFDYQNQEIGSGRTNGSGNLDIELNSKPFLVIASLGNERAYLKLQDGNALSTSHFDVSGNVVSDGIKGFIYGERGVWRPGDTLFLSFLLEDKLDRIPDDFPLKLELYNPKNQLKVKTLSTNHVNDLYSFVIPMSQEDITGLWRAHIQVANAGFNKYIRIETIKPNRLKIDFDPGTDMLSSNDKGRMVKLKTQWLHGAVARNMKARVALTLYPTVTRFEGYEDYSFTDYTKSYNADEQLMFEGKLNESGEAEVPLNINLGDVSPGKLRAQFTTRVFEPGGDFSIDRHTTTFSPFKNYVGVKLQDGLENNTYSTDSINYFNIVTLDESGEPVDVKNLEVSIYKTNWRWWWDSSNDYFGNYIGSNYYGKVHETKVSTVGGKARVDFKIDYPEWGRFVIRVKDSKSGHSATEFMYVDWPSWRGQNRNENPESAAVLNFDLDKEKYTIGDVAKVSIPGIGKGRALLTIENGSEILQAEWLRTKESELVHEIPITGEMSPNAYVCITLIQEYDHDNSLPIRLYGLIPIDVDDPSTRVRPKIKMDDELKPESQAEVIITEENGKATSYTLAIVDDGILDLTNYKTPDPHATFYTKEALGVKSWDMYDDVIGAYGGQLERILSIGGDGESQSESEGKINRFEPMVRFIGPFELDKNGKNRHSISIPNYIGSVRVMVVAGQNGAYGKAEKTVSVKKPLMVLASLPRVLGPGEKVKLPVTVFAMDEKIKDVKVEVNANSLFKKEGIRTKQIQFSEAGDQIVNFELEMEDAIGKGELTVNVTSGNESASYQVELEVRNPNIPVSEYKNVVLESDSIWKGSYSLFGVQSTNDLVLEVSMTPPIDFDRRLKQLISYPHGCAEQTTSKAFPQLYLENVMDGDKEVFEAANKNVKYSIDRLMSMQHTDGGFRFWPGNSESNDWVSSYVGHFLLEAQKKGFYVPSNVMNDWIHYQKRNAKNYSRYTDPRDKVLNAHRDFAQSYRLFTLALSGEADIGSMNRLRSENAMNEVGRWRLAAAYHLAGHPKVAEEIASSLKTGVTNNTSGTDDYYYYSYGSSLRDYAMILESLCIMDRKNEAIDLMQYISKQLSGDRWMSTQTTAYSLMSMVSFIGSSKVSNEMSFSYSVNGSSESSVSSQLPIKRIEIDHGELKNGSFTLKNNGSAMIYGRLITTGIPKYGKELVQNNNLELQVKYKSMDGKELDVSKLEQGTDFLAEVKIVNTNIVSGIRDLAMTQVFPSGWEIQNTRMSDAPNVYQTSKPTYEDIRDDRVMTYFDMGREPKVFRYVLNAAYLGEYYLPGVKAEAMYNGQIYARTKGQWINVVQLGSE